MLGMYHQDRSTGKGSKANSQKGVGIIVPLVREGTFSLLTLLRRSFSVSWDTSMIFTHCLGHTWSPFTRHRDLWAETDPQPMRPQVMRLGLAGLWETSSTHPYIVLCHQTAQQCWSLTSLIGTACNTLHLLPAVCLLPLFFNMVLVSTH